MYKIYNTIRYDTIRYNTIQYIHNDTIPNLALHYIHSFLSVETLMSIYISSIGLPRAGRSTRSRATGHNKDKRREA